MTAPARLSDAEVRDITAKLAARPVPPDHPPHASVVDIATRRPPLGLAPVPGDADDEREAASAKRAIGEEVNELIRVAIESLGGEENCRARHPTMLDEFETLSVALKTALEGDDDLHRAWKAKIAETHSEVAALRLENAQLRATIAEVRAKQNEHEFILERLRIENKGPPGQRGERGRDGREGQRGETGLRGEQGPPGPRVIGYETDDSAFVAVELLSDGRKGAALHLRGMFESYHAQVEGEFAAEEADAARAQRDAAERAAAASRT